MSVAPRRMKICKAIGPKLIRRKDLSIGNWLNKDVRGKGLSQPEATLEVRGAFRLGVGLSRTIANQRDQKGKRN